MTRIKLLGICILIIVISGTVFYFNEETLIHYFKNKDWKLVDSFSSVEISGYETAKGMLNGLAVIGTNYVRTYSNEGKEVLDLFVPFQEIVADSAGDYCVIAEKGGDSIYFLSVNEKIWNHDISGQIHDVSVNKNGYVSVIYQQSGYKSLVKVFSSTGKELFTLSLASTYAIDTEISNDNKKLAIAEVDTEGIRLTSKVKLIDMNHLSNENVIIIMEKEDCLITDIEYSEKNELLVKTDSQISQIVNGREQEVVHFEYLDTIHASIQNATNPILVKKQQEGLFETKYKMMVYSSNSETEEYELESLPKLIEAQGDLIAFALEKEILVIQTNGKLVKKFTINGSVKDLEFFNNANDLAVIFRDRIELIKV